MYEIYISIVNTLCGLSVLSRPQNLCGLLCYIYLLILCIYNHNYDENNLHFILFSFNFLCNYRMHPSKKVNMNSDHKKTLYLTVHPSVNSPPEVQGVLSGSASVVLCSWLSGHLIGFSQ